MCQQVSPFPLGARRWDGEGVIGVPLSMRHGESHDETRALGKRFGRDHEHRVIVWHLATHSRVVLDKDDLGPFRHP
jgi:hypothetical protein